MDIYLPLKVDPSQRSQIQRVSNHEAAVKKGRAGVGTYCAFFLNLTTDQGHFGAFGRLCVLSLIPELQYSLGVSLFPGLGTSRVWLPSAYHSEILDSNGHMI